MNVEYMTIPQYIEYKSKLVGKIATYDILIESMEKSILAAALGPDGTAVGQYAEYQLDDAQMSVRTRFRSVDQMISGLNGLRKIREDYINRYNGRVTTLRGGNLY